MSEMPRDALVRLAEEQGVGLASLSRMLDRNPAYLQQYVRRGSPRVLPEHDRALLARFFGVAERVLGKVSDADVEVGVPYLDVTASAGAGQLVTCERVRRHEAVPATTLARAGVRPQDASMIDVAGDSMAPLLLDGDRLLVDRGTTRVSATSQIMVLRTGDELLVKRVSLMANGAVRVASDNPDYATRLLPFEDVSIVGRACLLLRTL